jgi:chromosome segregation ATPase
VNIDQLPQQLEAFLENARAALDQQIGAAKHAVTALNAERTSTQNALADLQAQCKSAQAQLEFTTSEFHKIAAVVGVGHDLKKARAELERVRNETAEATKALEKLAKEIAARQAQIVALGNEVQRLVQVRTESEAVMANLRNQLRSVQIGQRP